jgi:hypothetical protein
LLWLATGRFHLLLEDVEAEHVTHVGQALHRGLDRGGRGVEVDLAGANQNAGGRQGRGNRLTVRPGRSVNENRAGLQWHQERRCEFKWQLC